MNFSSFFAVNFMRDNAIHLVLFWETFSGNVNLLDEYFHTEWGGG